MTHPSLIKYYNNDLEAAGNRTAVPLVWNIVFIGIALYAIVQFVF
ncbi:MAG: hypothetical protein ACI9EW_000772 [Cellvibrionaceae bacterium]|jgi:hypothetical protein